MKRFFPLSVFGRQEQRQPSRWSEPVFSLYRDINNLFEGVFRGQNGFLASPDEMIDKTPKTDVYETAFEVCVTVDLPGVQEKDIDVALSGDILTIRAERKAEQERKDTNYHMMERSWGLFSRSLKIPYTIDPQSVSASFKDGVLTVKAPKPEDAQKKEHRIPIQAGNSAVGTRKN